MELLLLGTAEPDEVEALTVGEDFDSRAYVRRMAAALEDLLPTSEAVSAIIDCPILDVRRAAIGPLLGLDLPNDLPDELADEIRRIYTGQKFWWPRSWCTGGMIKRRQLLSLIDTYAADPDQGLDFRTLTNSLPISYATIYGYLHDKGASSYHAKKTTPVHRCVEDVGGWLSKPRTRHAPHPVSVLACPHCNQRKLTQPLKVPEVPGQLLCTTCRRDWKTGWRYPDEYFLPWEGPQTLPKDSRPKPTNGGRYAPTRSGRIIVGSDIYDEPTPSLHVPQRQSRR